MHSILGVFAFRAGNAQYIGLWIFASGPLSTEYTRGDARKSFAIGRLHLIEAFPQQTLGFAASRPGALDPLDLTGERDQRLGLCLALPHLEDAPAQRLELGLHALVASAIAL